MKSSYHRSIAELFHRRVASTPHRTALLRKQMGTWTLLTWREIEAEVFPIARRLRAAGIQPGDRVAVLSQTRPEWLFFDQAILSLGAVTVPIYPALSPHDILFILEDCAAKLIFVEDTVQAAKISALRDRLPALKEVVVLGRAGTGDGARAFDEWVKEKTPALSLDDWRKLSRPIEADSLATIVYTSGTENHPKGVELSHQNLLSQVQDLAQSVPLREDDVTLLFLPVAHIMGRIEQLMSLFSGLANAYAENLSSLSENFLEIRPTVLVSVPRIYEKLYAAILHSFSAEGNFPWAKKPFEWALHVGRQHSQTLSRGRQPSLALKAQVALAERLYFSRVRERLGGRLRFAICGGAPLPRGVAEFFNACGVRLLEGYGLSESTGPATLNRVDDFRPGTVGKPLPSNELRLAPDGEVFLRGPALFRGYYHGERHDPKSWFATGDLGVVDNEGFVRITGRKKEVIVTSGGKNIAPQKIENLFRGDPLINQVMVLGEGHNFLVALLTLNLREARDLAVAAGLAPTEAQQASIEELLAHEGFQKRVGERVAQLNEKLAPYEAVRRYRILPRELSVEAGELTPSLKIRRDFCRRKYQALIDEMYA